MKLTKSLVAAAALTLALATNSARADDIDLYTGVGPILSVIEITRL